MEITFDKGLFVARIQFHERSQFKKALWDWSDELKRWTTADPANVETFTNACVGEASAIMERYLEEKNAVISESRALDTAFVGLVPEGKALYGFQNAGVEYALRRKDTLIGDDPGLGKQQPTYCKVLMADGSYTRIGDLEIGDKIASVDGTIQTVTGIFPQGFKPAYRVYFRDKTSTDCGPEHLWTVTTTQRRRKSKDPWFTATLEELLNRGITFSSGGKNVNKFEVPIPTPLNASDKKFPIDPYQLGVILGDGGLRSFRGGCCTISCFAPDADEIMASFDPKTQEEALEQYGQCRRFYVRGIQPALREVGLYRSLGRDKFIPEIYFSGSEQQRLSLLQGLMDTDGSASRNRITFHSSNHRLANDVARLVRSIGGVGIIREYDRPDKETYEKDIQVNVRLDRWCPFRINRKANQWKPASFNNRPKKAICKVERIEDQEQVCISVSHPSGLYITDDYIVTHNTTQAISVANEMFESGELEDVLILCEASQKAHWSRQWPDWTTTGLDIGVVERRVRQKNKIKRTVSIIPDTPVTVVNYDLLGQIHDWLAEQPWSLVIADECQALRNMEAQRTRYVFGDEERLIVKPAGRNKDGSFRMVRKRLEAVRAIRGDRRVFLTGTPIENRPHDLWPIIRAFDPEGLGSDYEFFIKRYCGAYWTEYGWSTSGGTNLIELQRYLRSTFMVRRTTQQALPDMPPKTRRPFFLPADDFKHVLKKSDDVFERSLDALEEHLGLRAEGETEDRMFSVWEELYTRYGDQIEDATYEEIMELVPEEASVAFEEIAKLRSELAVAKVPYIIRHVREITDAGEKVVVFFYHKVVGQALREAWGDSCGYIDGSIKPTKRQDEVDRFMEDPDCTAMFGQLHAASKGFTMTVARRAVFGELDWRPGTMKQAENRIWRISQENHCLIDHLIVESSIEVRQSHSLIEKQEQMDKALDHEESETQE